MYVIIPTIVVAIVSFIGGMYCEKVNSKSKVRPIKRALSNINRDRTLTMERSIITERDEPYKHTEQEIKDMFNKK